MAREYGRVATAFWNSAEMRQLSDGGKLLAAYLLTGPHSNAIGAYLLPNAYVADDLGWSLETVSKRFAELFAIGFATRFSDGRHICICKFLAWNPIENPNVAKAAMKQLDQLPNDKALQMVIDGMKEYAKHFPNGFETVSERFRNIEPNLTEPKPNPEPKPKSSSTDVDGEFEEFWKVYPKKVAKGAARPKFKAARAKATLGEILNAARAYAQSVVGSESKYIAHPASWLNGERWSDQGARASPEATIPSLSAEVREMMERQKNYSKEMDEVLNAN